MRDSPLHDKLFGLLKDLSPSWLHCVPWQPTPLLGVAELEPPSGTALCMGQPIPEGGVGRMDCGATGGVIEEIEFASYGTPGGHCRNCTVGACHAPATAEAVRAQCIGKRACSVQVSAAAFAAAGTAMPPGCAGMAAGERGLVVQARCSNASKQHTYWNFTLLDEQFLDVWAAIDGDSAPQIPNFSTPPTWLYDATDWSYNPVCTSANTCKSRGYEKGTAPASAHGGLEALGDCYGRLLAWYTRGGFTDEYGEHHVSGHHLNITVWEIFNEVDYEHGHTPQSYTLEFDAIVAGIRKYGKL